MKFTDEQMKDFNIKNWYDLSGQVSVVTGGASGLGLAITRCLVSAGAKVCVIGSRPAETAAQTLGEFGDSIAYYQFNITDTAHTPELVEKILADQGHIDILVNNAGNHCKKFIWDMTVEDYQNVLDVHLVGAFALTKAVVPQMKERGHGRIIFEASMTSYIGQPMVAGYSTAKAGYLGSLPSTASPSTPLRRAGSTPPCSTRPPTTIPRALPRSWAASRRSPWATPWTWACVPPSSAPTPPATSAAPASPSTAAR